MKTIIAIITLVSSFAFADQCAYVSKDQADRAKILVTDATVLFLCEACGETRAEIEASDIEKVRSSTVELMDREAGYYSLTINSKQTVDLAYLFVKVSDKRFVNVAKVVGCEASRVSNAVILE
jgi:hypothetical protein